MASPAPTVTSSNLRRPKRSARPVTGSAPSDARRMMASPIPRSVPDSPAWTARVAPWFTWPNPRATSPRAATTPNCPNPEAKAAIAAPATARSFQWCKRNPPGPGTGALPRLVGSAGGQPSGVTVGARRLAKPVRVGPGFIRAGFHAAGQRLGEHERCGGLEFAAEQIGGAGRLESQGPPVPAARADLGEFHRAPWFAAQLRGAGHDRPAGQREPADPPPLAYRPPAGQVTAVLAKRANGKGPLLPGLHAPAGAVGHLEDSRAAAVHLHLQRPAPANLDRQPAQLRIQEVGILA